MTAGSDTPSQGSKSPARTKHDRRRASVDRLSRREREVLAGLTKGLTNKGIGILLGISHRTVESHRARLMRRLGMATLPALLETASVQRNEQPDLGMPFDDDRLCHERCKNDAAASASKHP